MKLIISFQIVSPGDLNHGLRSEEPYCVLISASILKLIDQCCCLFKYSLWLHQLWVRGHANLYGANDSECLGGLWTLAVLGIIIVTRKPKQIWEWNVYIFLLFKICSVLIVKNSIILFCACFLNQGPEPAPNSRRNWNLPNAQSNPGTAIVSSGNFGKGRTLSVSHSHRASTGERLGEEWSGRAEDKRQKWMNQSHKLRKKKVLWVS